MKNNEKYSWIRFEIDLRTLPFQTWFLLGECVSKCRHISQIPLLPDVRDELHRIYLCKGVHATTAIEGNTLSEQQVRDILEGNATPQESKKYLQQEVENVIAACNEIRERLAKSIPFVLTSELLCEYNQWVLAHRVPAADNAVPGQFRVDRRGVGGYRAPAPEDVPGLVEQFCQWFGGLAVPDSLDAMAFSVLKAIIAHLYIELIHPFGDGNGRTGRLVEFTLLLSGGIPSPAAHLLSNHYNQTRMEYYRQLDRISKTNGDINAFFTYAIQGLHDGLQTVIDFMIEQTRAISWEHYIYEEFRRLPEKEKRQRNLLIAVSQQKRPLTRNEIETIAAKIYLEAGKTMNALTRDLNELVKDGWLIPEDGKYRAAIERILQRLPFSVQ